MVGEGGGKIGLHSCKDESEDRVIVDNFLFLFLFFIAYFGVVSLFAVVEGIRRL